MPGGTCACADCKLDATLGMTRKLLLLVLLIAASAHAQLQEKITVERILVDTRVTNDSGDPITGLKPEDFRVKIDGKLAKVESADWIAETAVARELANLDAPQGQVNTSLDQPAPRGRL